MKTLILYYSKTGFTEQYARWIGEALQAEPVPYKMRNTVSMEGYDTVIFGGGLHAGAIGGIGWLKKQKLTGKRVIVFATGASPAGTEEVRQALDRNLPEAEQQGIKVFYFQSGLNYEKMGLPDRLMMRAFRAFLKKTQGESEQYQMVSKSFSVSDQAFVLPLVEYAQS